MRKDIAYACRQSSKKNELKPHLKQTWCIGQFKADFIARMEDILSLYSEPYDPQYPVLCFDERPCFLIGEVVSPLPMQEGQVRSDKKIKIDWQFSIEAARSKMNKHYRDVFADNSRYKET